jgi:LDH2 family malate/lactate/ureidoglycolate dehydrogenase
MAQTTPGKRYVPSSLGDWTAAIFERAGVPADHARTAAGLLVRSDLRGWRTHGLTRVASYVQRLETGEFNPRPDMRHALRGGAIVFEADGAMGHVAAPAVVALGREQLRQQASVFVAVREIGHLGALGVHAIAAAESGVFCMLGQHTPPLLAMPGFKGPAIGHNPLAFGCPVPGADPLIFDMACSVAARGHILLAAREGRPIPEGWALDVDGAPTTDAQRALAGPLLPAGGHKGVGLAMMIELLAGAFGASAESMSRPPTSMQSGGASGRESAFFWFVDPGAFASREVFDAYMAQWTGTYLEAGGEAGRLPGHRGAELERALLVQGLDVPPAIEQELRVLGDRLGVPFQPQSR